MQETLPVVGIHRDEIQWVCLLVDLLRHPDPVVPELVRQALVYVSGSTSASQSHHIHQ